MGIPEKHIKMKQVYVCLLMLLAMSFVHTTDAKNGTAYLPGTVWSYYQYDWDQHTFFRYTLDGDTTIGSKTYQKMYVFSTCAYQRQEAQYVGAIREEVSKVYCQLVDTWGLPLVDGEAELYDFTLQVGDSVVRYGEPVAYVISIDSVMVGESKCKRLRFGYQKPDTYVFDCWIEGMGSTMRSFFKPLYALPTCPCGDVLNVFNNPDGITVYTNPETTSRGFLAEDCLYNGLETMDSHNGLMLYPNPAVDRLHLACDEPVACFDVLAMDGRVLWTATSNEVDVSSLPAGIYFIRALTESGKTLKTSFIKRVQ